MDIDECDLIRPCDEMVSCVNEDGGFVCGSCPPGFEGSSGWRGAGDERRREQCVDIDECGQGLAHCPRGRLCVNTPVRYLFIYLKYIKGSVTYTQNDIRRTRHLYDLSLHDNTTSVANLI